MYAYSKEVAPPILIYGPPTPHTQ